jgi:large-conductance mechanosensitive channel
MSFGSGNEISKLKQFIIDNNIVGTSAGVCVALAAKDGIESLVGDIIIPIIIMLLHALRIDALSKFLPVNGSDKLNINDFVKQMVTFILIIIISFVFVQFAFGYLLGIDSNKKADGSPADTATTADAVKTASMVNTNSSSLSGPKEKFSNYGDIFSGVGSSSNFASANF